MDEAAATPTRSRRGQVVTEAVSDQGWRRVALGAVSVGAVIRCLYGLVAHRPFDHVYSDMAGYVQRAEAVVHGVRLTPESALFPPGTHLVLAAPLAVFGDQRSGLWAAAVLWTVMSSAIPVAAYGLATPLFGRRVAALTAGVAALWPPLITYGGYFTSEIPATLFLLLALVCLQHVRGGEGRTMLAWAAAGGVTSIAAIAVRPQFVLNIALAVAVAGLVRRRAVRAGMILVASAALPLAAVLALNNQTTGVTTLGANGGVNFFQGHCNARNVVFAQALPGERFWVASPVALYNHRGSDYAFPFHRVTDQGFLYGRGLHCISRDGLHNAVTVARNATDLGATSPLWPQMDERSVRAWVEPIEKEWSIGLLLVIAWALFRGVRRRLPRQAWLMLAHLGCAVLVAAVFYGDPRFRVPYDVFGFALLLSMAFPGDGAWSAPRKRVQPACVATR